DQIREVLGLEYVGITPLIKVEEYKNSEADRSHPRAIKLMNNVSAYVVDHPLSVFAETMRSAKIALDLRAPAGSSKVIGIVSTLPGEGKATVASNLAQLLAMQGARTLLIDADLRNPGASRALARHAEAGLLEVLLDARPFHELLLLDQKTKL